jgi:hypothetical protein
MMTRNWRATPLAAGAPRRRDWDETARLEEADDWSALARLWAIGRQETEMAQADLYWWLAQRYPTPTDSTLTTLFGAHSHAAELLEELTYPVPLGAEPEKRSALCVLLARVAARAGLLALDRGKDPASAAVLAALERECLAFRQSLLQLGGSGL